MKQIFHDLFCWSVFNERRQIDFNGHLWVREEGNVLIDPVPMISSDLEQLNDFGGAKYIVITNKDHERDTKAFRDRYRAEVVSHCDDASQIETVVDRTIVDGEQIVPGLQAVQLRYGKSDGEIALYFSNKHTIVAGDLLVGAPIGQFSLLMDSVLKDPPAAALELRKLLALDFDAIVVGDGHSVMYDARQRLLECLESRTDVYINRINIDEVEWIPHAPREGYAWGKKEIDALIGARNLGYQLINLPAGEATFPSHWHRYGEELFFVIDGESVLITPRGEVLLRAGDFVAFPPGPSGTHKVLNRGTTTCTLLAVGDHQDNDVAEYPDSDKINVFDVMKSSSAQIFRKTDVVDYWDGE